jgi:hypothetical protein
VDGRDTGSLRSAWSLQFARVRDQSCSLFKSKLLVDTSAQFRHLLAWGPRNGTLWTGGTPQSTCQRDRRESLSGSNSGTSRPAKAATSELARTVDSVNSDRFDKPARVASGRWRKLRKSMSRRVGLSAALQFIIASHQEEIHGYAIRRLEWASSFRACRHASPPSGSCSD